jgi:hypothetical protein
MQRQKITPQINVPIYLQLETVYGQECRSTVNGVEYRYNVRHENQPGLIYLTANGRDALLRAQPRVGDVIELVRQKRGQATVYAVTLCDGQPWQADPDQNDAYEEPEYQEPPQPMRMLAPQQRQPMRIAPPPQQQQPAAGTGRAASTQPQFGAPPPRPDANLPPIAQQLAGCMRVALDAWEETVAYAKSKGVELDYSSEDVRCTGLSVYINHQDRAKRQAS